MNHWWWLSCWLGVREVAEGGSRYLIYVDTHSATTGGSTQLETYERHGTIVCFCTTPQPQPQPQMLMLDWIGLDWIGGGAWHDTAMAHDRYTVEDNTTGAGGWIKNWIKLNLSKWTLEMQRKGKAGGIRPTDRADALHMFFSGCHTHSHSAGR